MSKIYDRIEYVGKTPFLKISILPRRTRVNVSRTNPYIFTDEDSQDESAIRYYQSLYNVGLRLHKIDNNEEEKSQDSSASVEKEVVKDPAENKEQEDTKSEEVVDEVVEDVAVEEASDSSITNEELIEFLDLNYDEESLRSLAKEVGIKRINYSWSHEDLINKILESGKDHVIKLMKQ